MKMQVKYVDRDAEMIASGITLSVRNAATRYVRETLQPIVDREARVLGLAAAAELRGEEASQVLSECIRCVTQELRKWADGYTPMRWLWMLRRLPHEIFRGDYITTAGYDTALAEVLSGQSVCHRCGIRVTADGVLHYQLDSGVIRRLARFCEGVRFLSDLHRCYRWAGKGASLAFKKGESPDVRVSGDIRSAVEAYDRRVEKTGRPLNRTGSVLTSGDLSESLISMLWVHSINTVEIPTLRPGASIHSATPDDYILAACRFMPESLPLAGLARLLEDRRVRVEQVVSRDVAILVFLLAALYVFAARHIAGYWTLMARGYLLWTGRTAAIQAIDDMFQQLPDLLAGLLHRAAIHNTSELLEAACGMRGCPWPLVAGPICRECGNGICFDFASVTMRLEALFEFPPEQGGLANARSQHFEDEVQAVIDRSRWRPHPEIAALRGRQLSHNGRVITDIDAIGESDGALLIVDCKSFVYSGAYDIGDYKAIRNVSTLVRDSLRHWSGICTHLIEYRKGDNYDMSRYRSILGVVCTPHVAYSDKDTILAEAAPGLPGVASVVELGQWLGVAMTLQDQLRSIREETLKN
jgi:hypothetical protein